MLTSQKVIHRITLQKYVLVARKNHNAKNCFKRIREEKAEKTKSSKPTCYNMFNVSGTAAPFLVNMKIGNEIVTMEDDSGAAISVMRVNNPIPRIEDLYVKPSGKREIITMMQITHKCRHLNK